MPLEKLAMFMKIVACIAEKTARNALRMVKIAKKQGANFAEIRLDYLNGSELTSRNLSQLEISSPLPLIATMRRKQDAGRYSGKEKNRASLLSIAIESGFDFIDVELNSPYSKKLALLARKRKCNVICSIHSLNSTPRTRKLNEWLSKSLSIGNYSKIVCLAKTPADCERILSLYKKAPRGRLTAFAMGEIGSITRIQSALNSGFAYCSVNKKVAKGQFTVKQFKELTKNAN